MFNHLRTLLLNRDGDEGVAPWVIGEEAVPAAYRAVNLPTYLDTVRSVLFDGPAPDRSRANYRLTQYLRILHAVPFLDASIRALDPRITYLGSDRSDLFDPAAFTPVVSTVPGSGAADAMVALQVTSDANDEDGRSYHEYLVTVTATRTVTVTRQQPAPRFSATAVTLAAGTGKSTTIIPLPDTRFGVLVDVDAPVGAAWTIVYHARPRADVSAVVETAAQGVSEPVLLSLFGAAPVEPYASFYDLFTQSKELPDRLGGLLLAVGYRTEEKRAG